MRRTSVIHRNVNRRAQIGQSSRCSKHVNQRGTADGSLSPRALLSPQTLKTKFPSSNSVPSSLELELLLCKSLRLSKREDILRLKRKDALITREQSDQFFTLVERRIKHEPLAYILGRKEFWSNSFEVSKATLIPRPETELIVEKASLLFKDSQRDSKLKILDLGTGSGAILLSLLRELESSSGLGVDISSEALEIARRNAVALSLQNRASFQESNWVANVAGKYDLIVSNPPYIQLDQIESLEQHVRQYEPHLALVGGHDGLECYRQIASTVQRVIHPSSVMFFEIGINQLGPVREIFQQQGFICIEVLNDLQGIPRCLVFKPARS